MTISDNNCRLTRFCAKIDWKRIKSSNTSAKPKTWSCHYHDHSHCVNYRRSSIADTSELNQNTWITSHAGWRSEDERGRREWETAIAQTEIGSIPLKREEESKRRERGFAQMRWETKQDRDLSGGNRPCDIAVAGRAIPLRVTLTNSTAICMPRYHDINYSTDRLMHKFEVHGATRQ